MKKIKKTNKPDIKEELPVYNFLDGKEVKSVKLNEKIFDGDVNKPLLHQLIIKYQASKRAGTASTKTRGEVSGGGKKPWRQKGTGRARAGSIRSPVWKGGGAVFGPHQRDYSYTIPRKARALALKSALNVKLRAGELFLVEDIKLPQPRTNVFFKSFKKFIKAASKIDIDKAEDKKTIFVVKNTDSNLKLASRNVPFIFLANADNCTALDALLYKNVVISLDALETIYKRLKERKI